LRVRRSVKRAEHAAARFARGRGKRMAATAKTKAAGNARTAMHALPEPAQRNVRRTWRFVGRARHEPIPAAKAVERKARGVAKRRLPKPVQQPLRRADRLYQRARSNPRR